MSEYQKNKAKNSNFSGMDFGGELKLSSIFEQDDEL